jgi:hypothetical protein
VAGNHDSQIVVNSVTPLSATALVANITISATATIAFRNVSVLTGAQLANETTTGPFLVTAVQLAIPRLTSISPPSANVGQTLTINVVGQNTTFSDGVSVLSVGGGGVVVHNTVVTSPTTLSASLTISSGAPPGFRDVFVTTNAETAALLGGFNIVGGPPTAQPPTGLYAALISGNVVTLRWAAPVAGLVPTNYVVEGGIAPGEVLGGFATGSPYPITTFTAPTGSFRVRVHTISGADRSTASNEILINVNVPVAPSAPAGLTGTRNGSALALAWRPTFAGGEATSLFLDVAGAFNGSLPLGLSDSFSFNGVPPGSYTFSLRAVNAAGVSSASNAVTLSFPGTCSGAPLPPANFLAYRNGNTLTIVWDPAASGPAPTGYVLNVGGAFSGSFGTPGRTLSGTVPAGTYQFSVLATNDCGASAATAVQSVQVP